MCGKKMIEYEKHFIENTTTKGKRAKSYQVDPTQTIRIKIPKKKKKLKENFSQIITKKKVNLLHYHDLWEKQKCCCKKAFLI